MRCFNWGATKRRSNALSMAVEIQPGLPFAGKLYVLMGRAARALGQLDSAEEHFRRAMAIEPDEAAALLDLAGVLRTQGRRDEADALMNRARELRPGDSAHLQNIAEALRKEQRYDEGAGCLSGSAGGVARFRAGPCRHGRHAVPHGAVRGVARRHYPGAVLTTGPERGRLAAQPRGAGPRSM